jgi:ribosomal protein S27E
MTAADRYLQEKLNPAKADSTEAVAQKGEEALQTPCGFLRIPLIDQHRVFWSFAAILVIALIDAVIMEASGAFEVLERGYYYSRDWMALAVSMITPVNFWLPLVIVARWAWHRVIAKVLLWFVIVWMIVIHSSKMLSYVNQLAPRGFMLVIILFLVGLLGIVMTVRMAIKDGRKKRESQLASQKVSASVVSTKTEKVQPRNVTIKCPKCKKKFRTYINSAESVVRCPNCLSEEDVVAWEAHIREPVPLRLTRAILFYWCGLVSMIVMPICCLFRGNIIGIVIAIAFAFLSFKMESSLEGGRGWPRIVILILFFFYWPCLIPAVLTFLPASQDWLDVKRMIIKRWKKNDF